MIDDNVLQPIEEAVDKEIKKYSRKIEKNKGLIERNQSLILEQGEIINEAESIQRQLQVVIAECMDENNEYVGAIKALEALKKVL